MQTVDLYLKVLELIYTIAYIKQRTAKVKICNLKG